MSRLWEGRQTGASDDVLLELGASIQLDIELYREDLAGSRAHAKMLERAGILTSTDLGAILEGLNVIEREIETGKFEIKIELEDIHTHVESRLTQLIGPAAGRLHTARSRNDQIAVDTHLYVRRLAREIMEQISGLCDALIQKAEAEVDSVLPGYTHLQVAQPVRVSHHLLAHFWGFLRDIERFTHAYNTANRLPLGSGALAGVNYKTDREFLRQELGFFEIYQNSMDAVASRDHIQDFLYACTSFGVRASRFAEEIILWNSVEFGFIKINDGLTTGSSIMPQKKNPDAAELVRGRAGRNTGNLINLLMTLKGLPFAYNRDLQEDRTPLLDSAKNTHLIARALQALVRGMTFQKDRLTASLDRGFATATDLADALVLQKNIPFREAHHIAGKLVGLCSEQNLTLAQATPAMRSACSEHLTDDAFYLESISTINSTDRKISQGGTARIRQIEQLAIAKAALADRAQTWSAK
ncbi:MAG: argininosuccinate lyase [Spirochaetia bacterium]|nr:argininosuccinate lyase [Spirochaetia bacterium]